jgi:hypothetical protein
MSTKRFTPALAVLAALAWAAPEASANAKTKAAQEAAEYVLQKFGRKAAKDGARALARRIETAAAAHGDEVFKAVRLAGPQGLRLIEKAGAGGGRKVAGLLARHGEKGAVWVAARPRGMALFLKHGESAAAALVKHPGVAEPVVEKFGRPAVRALNAVGGQNGRRLAMMAAEGGELGKIARAPEVLDVIAKYGNPACDFVWRNKGALAVAAAAAAFLAEPEPFISGARDITRIAAESAVKPIAEVPAAVAREGTREVAKRTNWTAVFLAGIGAVGLLLAARWRLFRRPATAPLAAPVTGPPAGGAGTASGDRSPAPASTGEEKPCP